MCLLCFSVFFLSAGYAFELKEIERVEGEEYYKKKKSKKLSEKTLPRSDEKKLKKIYDSIIKDMVECPAGTFMMGSPENELGHINDEILHKEIIDVPF